MKKGYKGSKITLGFYI